jgi:hypothetical protein
MKWWLKVVGCNLQPDNQSNQRVQILRRDGYVKVKLKAADFTRVRAHVRWSQVQI